jgi:hypothetical protein
MVFTSSETLFEYLTDMYLCQDNPSVDIATFGMYLGLSKGKDWHELYPVAPRKFIDIVNKSNLRVLVGKPFLMTCTPNCKHCIKLYKDKQIEVDRTIKELAITAKKIDRFHMKMYRVGDVYVSGGINFGASNWIDVSFTIRDKSQKMAMQQLFNKVWEGGKYHGS